MTVRDVEYNTREDDNDLSETLEIMHNQHMIFENCSFSLCKEKQFNSCHFIHCIFEGVAGSHFNNCTFDSPKFYFGFNGIFNDCSIHRYSGRVGDLKEREK